MDNLNYYSASFPVYAFPKDKKIAEHPLEKFCKIIDMLFLLADVSQGTKFFKKPMNFLVLKDHEKYFIGINYTKALLRMCSMNEIRTPLYEDAEYAIRKGAIDELGMNLDAIICLSINNFKKIEDKLVTIFDNNLDYLSRVIASYDFLQNEDMAKCLFKVKEGIKMSTSVYGGNGMWINPIFKAKDLTVDPNLCFCVLPFNDDRLEIFDEIIKPNLEKDYGLSVIRSGNIFEPNQNLMESIWTYINKAAFVITDMSDRNPNVFYELGICHTLGKPVITLCDQDSYEKDYGGKLPFDISAINTIFYKNSGAGPQKLIKEIEKNIEAIRSGKAYIE